MRLSAAIIFALSTAVLAKPPPLKTVVVSYPNDTPSSVVDNAIEEIKGAGGIITHEYCKCARRQRGLKGTDEIIRSLNQRLRCQSIDEHDRHY